MAHFTDDKSLINETLIKLADGQGYDPVKLLDAPMLDLLSSEWSLTMRTAACDELIRAYVESIHPENHAAVVIAALDVEQKYRLPTMTGRLLAFRRQWHETHENRTGLDLTDDKATYNATRKWWEAGKEKIVRLLEREIESRNRHGWPSSTLPQESGGQPQGSQASVSNPTHLMDITSESANDRPDGQTMSVEGQGSDPVRFALHEESDPTVKAVLAAAVDAQRLGYQSPIPHDFLAQAAVGYLDEQQRSWVDSDQIKEALRRASSSLHGDAMPALTPVRISPGLGVPDFYIPTEVLDEFGRARVGQLPSPEFWNTLLVTEHQPSDLLQLALDAEKRYLWRHAAALSRLSADAGDAEACRLLGRLLVEARHKREAKIYLGRIADAGDTAAMVQLAELASGYEEAIEWLNRARDAGSIAAGRRMADMRKSYDESVYGIGLRSAEADSYIASLAESGDPWSMLNWAHALRRQGFPDDADHWVRRSALAGCAEAMSELAKALERRGMVDDAESWLRKYAAEDQYDGWLKLARFLIRTQRVDEAESTWRQQIAKGDEGAIRPLATLLTSTSRRDEAEDLLGRAAQIGDVHAARELGLMLRKNKRGGAAEKWLRMAAETGDSLATRAYAETLERSGRIGEAEAWLRYVIEAGNFSARTELGGILVRTRRSSESNRLDRFGIEPGGRTAKRW